MDCRSHYMHTSEAENLDLRFGKAEEKLSILEVASMSGSDRALTEDTEVQDFSGNEYNIQELLENKDKLQQLVKTLKKDLADWRQKVCIEMRNYQDEVGELKQELSNDLGRLKEDYGVWKTEFQMRRAERNAQMQVSFH